MSEHGYVPIKLYYTKQVACQIRTMGCSLPIPITDHYGEIIFESVFLLPRRVYILPKAPNLYPKNSFLIQEVSPTVIHFYDLDCFQVGMFSFLV